MYTQRKKRGLLQGEFSRTKKKKYMKNPSGANVFKDISFLVRMVVEPEPIPGSRQEYITVGHQSIPGQHEQRHSHAHSHLGEI